MRSLSLGLLVAVVVVAAGCGSDSEEAAAPPQTVTVTETATVAQEEADPAPVVANSSSADLGAGEEDEPEASGGGDITVPNVVGKDHQLAQDTMQAAGLYSLREEDATGQGRALIIDRNWTVVRQRPAAGSKVSEDATVTLYSKKDDE